jgi:hypothetical protein
MTELTPRRLSCLLCLVGGAACAQPSPAALTDASVRSVETPSAVAVLSQTRTESGLPGAITFGDPRGRSALFLQFPAAWRAQGAPLRAYLVLEPRVGSPPDPEPVTVEAWRVRSRWQSSKLRDWADKPELAPPYAHAVASGSPARELRIDVTALLRFAADNPALDQGIALIATPGDGHGVSFATGIDGGAAPRLEVYTR